MNPPTAHFFVILVHFGADEPTHRLLTSLVSQTVKAQEVLIIDHAQTPLNLKNTDASVSLFRPSQNAGYSGGVNMALGMLVNRKLDPHDVVIVLNNDVTISPNFLEQLQSWWNGQTDPGLVGKKLSFVNPWTGRAGQPKGLPYLEGSFLAATYQTWMRLKGLPDNYFLYWEDVALSWQASRKGLALQIILNLPIHHDYSEQLPSDEKLYYLIRNGAVCLETETTGFRKLYWVVFNRLRYVYHGYFSRQPGSEQTAQALRAAVTHKMGQYTAL